MLIFRRIHCIHAAYDTVTFYDISWWPVGAKGFDLNNIKPNIIYGLKEIGYEFVV
jgi:hypothetical protein